MKRFSYNKSMDLRRLILSPPRGIRGIQNQKEGFMDRFNRAIGLMVFALSLNTSVAQGILKEFEIHDSRPDPIFSPRLAQHSWPMSQQSYKCTEERVLVRNSRGYLIGERADSLRGRRGLYSTQNLIPTQEKIKNQLLLSPEKKSSISSLGLNFGCGLAMNRAWLGGAEWDYADIFFFFPFKGAIFEAKKDIFLKFGITSETGLLYGSRNDIRSHIGGRPTPYYWAYGVTFETYLFPLTFTLYYRVPIKESNLYFGIYGIGFYLSRGIEYERMVDENLKETGKTLIVKNWGKGICWQQSIVFEAPISDRLFFNISIIPRNGDITEFKNDVPDEYKWSPANMKLNGLYFNFGFYYHLK
jgi:hypothetical protein